MIRAARSDIVSRFDSLKFDAIMTVVHGLGWLVAASVARDAGVPLHLIMHDDWPRVANVPAQFRTWLDRRFGKVYQQASSRMCVSPFMRADYLKRYGCDSEVLYPSQAKECPSFESVPSRLGRNDGPLTIAFAGTINSEGYIRALRALSESVSSLDGRLLIFGPTTHEEGKQIGLGDAHVMFCGLLAPSELIVRLRNEADVLFVPMSFSESDRSNMEMAFPSKLADYTATGLPLLVYGPSYCSAVRWAHENAGVAEVVAVEDQGLLAAAVGRLASPKARIALGQRALQVGRRFFSYDASQRIFHNVLLSRTLE
jgi:glycosyltransferase involved in cell wall biosynthesis